MKIFNFLAVILAFTFLLSCSSNDTSITSPSEELNASFSINEGVLQLQVSRNYKVISTIECGIFTINNEVIGYSYQIENVIRSSRNQSWTPVYGEKKIIQNNYNEIGLSLKDKRSEKRIKLLCRAYNEGIAFRYLYDQTSFKQVQLEKELTTFNFEDENQAWATDRAQGTYLQKNINEIETA